MNTITPKSAAPVAQKEPGAIAKAIVKHIPQCITADHLSWSRVYFMPLFGTWFYFKTEIAWPTLVGCSLAGLTDWLDGLVARVRGSETLYGAHLDAQADRAAILSMAIPAFLKVLEQMLQIKDISLCLTSLFVVLALTIIGELIAFGVRQRRYARAKRGLSTDHDVKATKLSKTKTFAEFVAGGLLIISFSRDDLEGYSSRIALILLCTGGAVSLLGYLWDRWLHHMWKRWFCSP